MKDGASRELHSLTQQDSTKVASTSAGDPHFFMGMPIVPVA